MCPICKALIGPWESAAKHSLFPKYRIPNGVKHKHAFQLYYILLSSGDPRDLRGLEEAQAKREGRQGQEGEQGEEGQVQGRTLRRAVGQGDVPVWPQHGRRNGEKTVYLLIFIFIAFDIDFSVLVMVLTFPHIWEILVYRHVTEKSQQTLIQTKI